jgi:hypothetical protein
MSYKVQHKENKNVIGIFDEVDEQAINQLIKNNGSNIDQYDVIEFTPEINEPTVEEQQKAIEQQLIPTDIETLYDILKSKNVLSDDDIPEQIKSKLENKATLTSQLQELEV